ncbi:hypothetical protein EOA75_09705 [Mesorhizobium sp. M1A.F.Ca.IN.022.07.1.1]|uniref:hypothetical protein n=1 Tax=unclassified Mesorhizobium TaxID=325217 RepID=UPI000FCBC1EB|nr:MULTISPECIES: hypothetical protein [unclassified Mesorhizobium]RUV95199.1 hypothetical protein EOA75_09705 [Mesorhizobium sp. M1A.F.Ca.IN.022.07.1.1]RWM65125.1 MAG: hypothetical protein EOR82_31195 [Mesorhizobium sp.]RWM89587.1 MAG: hypothetical protein EOR86_29600 [Mesorhizobium sp.]TIS47848.1 MAG: hypothetical protein E5X11_18035 [Mesorhizobium sp.]TJV54607.1 MAG: hypothetical protein E5X82_30995 [Mesorhizobium sp.]
MNYGLTWAELQSGAPIIGIANLGYAGMRELIGNDVLSALAILLYLAEQVSPEKTGHHNMTLKRSIALTPTGCATPETLSDCRLCAAPIPSSPRSNVDSAAT